MFYLQHYHLSPSEMGATVLYLPHYHLPPSGMGATVFYLPTLPLISLRDGSDCVLSAHITTYLPQGWERLCSICPHYHLSPSEMRATVLYLPHYHVSPSGMGATKCSICPHRPQYLPSEMRATKCYICHIYHLPPSEMGATVLYLPHYHLSPSEMGATVFYLATYTT